MVCWWWRGAKGDLGGMGWSPHWGGRVLWWAAGWAAGYGSVSGDMAVLLGFWHATCGRDGEGKGTSRPCCGGLWT